MPHYTSLLASAYEFIIAVGGDPIEVAIRGPKLLARRIHQQIPGALDVLRRERLAVVPFDAMLQRQGRPCHI
jgi:hypothetical protein